MKLISGKDYYDGASYGFDDMNVFVRGHELVDKPSFLLKERNNWVYGFEKYKSDSFLEYSYVPFNVNRRNRYYNNIESVIIASKEVEVKFFLVFFCGKLYKGLMKWPGTEIKMRDGWSIESPHFFYDYDEFASDMKKYKVTNKSQFKIKMDYIHRFFDKEFDHPNLHNWFHSHNIAIGLIPFHKSQFFENALNFDKQDQEKNKVLINFAGLDKLEFYKKVDPFSAHQELDMFIGGVLTNHEKMVTISDKSKIVKAGFDIKKSFRKAKTNGREE